MKDNQMKPKRTQAAMKLLAVMVMLGFAMQVVAQPVPKGRRTRDDEHPGLIMTKTVSGEDPNLTLTLESFVTGSVTVHMEAIPTDITLVLDCSGSMDEPTTKWAEGEFANFWTDIEPYLDKVKGATGGYYQIYKIADGYPQSRHYLRYYDGNWQLSSRTNTDGRYSNITNSTLNTYRSYGLGIRKMALLREACASFIDVVHSKCDTDVKHRISIVKYSGENGSGNTYLTEGNTSGSSQLVKNLMYVDTDANVTTLKNAINAIAASGGTSVDVGMTIANAVQNPTNTSKYSQLGINFDDRTHVALMFTDGEPTGSGTSFSSRTANAAIAKSKNLKDRGVLVYSAGVFDQMPTVGGNIDMYMNRVSSNYLDATTYQNGTKTSDAYYKLAADADELEDIFKEISESISDISWDLESTTVVQDVISDYFVLPEDTDEDDILVFTADYAGGEYTWDEADEFTSAQKEIISVLCADGVTRRGVRVKNFDFSDNWVGWDEENHEYHGKKLIIEIPIQPKYNEYGVLPTNELAESGVYPDIEDNPIGNFTPPVYYVKQTTWVQHTYEEPSTDDIELVTIGEGEDAHDVYEIKTNEGLAWFISLVSGYNGEEGDPDAEAILANDVDMSAYCWVPIGGGGECMNYDPANNTWSTTGPSSLGFSGTFDGQGHVIRGLNNHDAWTMPEAGLFGCVDGGTITNTFLVDADFNPAVGKYAGTLSSGMEGYFGIIADTLCNGAVLMNSEAHGVIRTFRNECKIYENDQEYDSPVQNPQKCYIGGLVGLVGRNRSGEDSPAIVHSCVSVASLEGYSMGGVVNEVSGNPEHGTFSTLANCYSYPTFRTYVFDFGTNLGGLAGVNKGKILNCYIRERATNESAHQYGILAALGRVNNPPASGSSKDGNRGTWHKGLLVGFNQGSVNYCYVPSEWSAMPIVDINSSKLTAFVGEGCADGDKPSGLASFTGAETPYMYMHYDTKLTLISGTGSNPHISTDSYKDRLLIALNHWVDNPAQGDANNYSNWFRTTADGINNDYPVLKIAGLQSVASDDQVVLFYGDINNALATTGRKMMTSAKTNDFICLYENAAVTEANNGTTLYINEDVAITQTEDLDAYVGITLDNSKGASGINNTHPEPTYNYADPGIDWHMFSTSLSNAPLGVNYTDNNEWPFNYEPDTVTVAANRMPEYSFYAESVHDGYFPSKRFAPILVGEDQEEEWNYYKYWDFYCWNEPSYHYINFKRNSSSHWMENSNYDGTSDINIEYENEEELVKGKGYMVATAEPTFLQSHGTLNKGEFTYPVTHNENPFCVGYNLIGNPYQSYLDFDKFVEVNNPDLDEDGINTYYILNEDAGGYTAYTYSQSGEEGGEGEGEEGGAKSIVGEADRYINMHQGFFIYAEKEGDVTFNESMRKIELEEGEVGFRGGKKAVYPWVKLTMTEESGYRDYTTIEFDRPELGGGKKMKDLRLGDAIIYANYDGVGYCTFFATSDITSVPVRFVTVADGTFTLSWRIGNARFGNLYLVDNINGQKIDMLSHNTYKFEGRASDYASRFKIVFELNEAEEENEDLNEDTNFAFQMGDNLIVNGEGRFEMYDACGRLVMATSLYDVQNSVAVPEMARGIYVLRLAGDKSVKVQKIVVR